MYWVPMYATMMAVIVVPLVAMTILAILLVRRLGARGRMLILTGAALPAAALLYGLRMAWPWPWWRAERLRDGFPPGPLLIEASLWALPLCLLASLLAKRRPVKPPDRP
jgi:hypothetical protein